MYVCAVARESGVYFIYVLYKVMLKCLKSCHKLFICAVIAEDVLPPPPSPLPRCRFSIPRSRRASERERIRIYLRAACYFKMIIFIVDHDWGRFRPGAHTHTHLLRLLFIVRPARSKKTHTLADCGGDLWEWICVELITGAALFIASLMRSLNFHVSFIVSRLSNNNPSCQRLFK